MPYTREEASNTAFVRKIVEQAKVEYLERMEKDLTDFYDKHRTTENWGVPAVINNPPTDVGGKYTLYQDPDTLEYLRSIDFVRGVYNMIVITQHERKLADPKSALNVINPRFEQADQILTREDVEEMEGQKGNYQPTDDNDKGNVG